MSIGRRCALPFVAALISLVPGVLAAAGAPRGREIPVPEAAKYWVLFRHLTALEAKAAELEQRGEDGAPYRTVYRDNAKLTDGQAARLSSIATDCVARVEEKDREATALIRAARAKVPGGRLEKGELPPEPPAELGRLQGERDALILAARDDLRRALGDEEFARFARFVDEKVASKIRVQPATPAAH